MDWPIVLSSSQGRSFSTKVWLRLDDAEAVTTSMPFDLLSCSSRCVLSPYTALHISQVASLSETVIEVSCWKRVRRPSGDCLSELWVGPWSSRSDPACAPVLPPHTAQLQNSPLWKSFTAHGWDDYVPTPKSLSRSSPSIQLQSGSPNIVLT